MSRTHEIYAGRIHAARSIRRARRDGLPRRSEHGIAVTKHIFYDGEGGYLSFLTFPKCPRVWVTNLYPDMDYLVEPV